MSNEEQRAIYVDGFNDGLDVAKRETIERACEYLATHIDPNLVVYFQGTWKKRDAFIQQFREAMESYGND